MEYYIIGIQKYFNIHMYYPLFLDGSPTDRLKGGCMIFFPEKKSLFQCVIERVFWSFESWFYLEIFAWYLEETSLVLSSLNSRIIPHAPLDFNNSKPFILATCKGGGNCITYVYNNVLTVFFSECSPSDSKAFLHIHTKEWANHESHLVIELGL